jgi:hypothetical protein
VGPIAEFESLVADLGEIALKSMSDSRQVKFTVRNVGSGTLKLDELRLSCGCTSGKITRQELLPGESGEILVLASLGVSGSRSVAVTVVSNCVKNPSTSLRIRWNAVAPVLVEPEEVDLGRLLTGESRTAEVRLRRSPGGECQESQMSVDVPAATSGLAATLEDDVVTIFLEVKGAAGTRREFVNVKLNDCWRGSIRIPVSWEVVPRVSVVPSSIHVGSVQAGRSVSRRIVVRSNDGGL